jgi:hypothetical protein
VKVRSYRELKVWQHGMKLAEEIYCLTETFPKYETYALSNQIQRVGKMLRGMQKSLRVRLAPSS